MKKLLLTISLFFWASGVEAQLAKFCQNDSTLWGQPYPIFDTIDFEQTHTSIGHLIIDTTFPNNIWQIGAVQKTGFPNAYTGLNALQTDTINSYPANNESVLITYADTMFSQWNPADKSFSLCFWHYYDVDTLTDTCKLQMTLDSGKTWMDYQQFKNYNGGFLKTDYIGSLNNNGNQTYQEPILYWSGSSGGWKKECLCNWTYIVLKGQQFQKNYGLRFYFHSDSIQTNKPGWMIDDLTYKGYTLGAINDHLLQSANIYPNPSSNGIFNIDYPQHYVKGRVEIFNVFGQRIKTLPLSPSINLQDIPRGIYHYTLFFENTAQQFGGTLLYE